MKKLLAVAMSLIITVSMSVPVFADPVTDTINEITNGNNTATHDIKGIITAAKNPEEETISVNVIWQDVTFTYTGGTKTWNPETLEYDTPDEAWTTTVGSAAAVEGTTAANVVTVENRSDTSVDAKLTASAAEAYTDYLSFDGGQYQAIPAATPATGGAEGTAQRKSFPLVLNESKAPQGDFSGVIGAMTVTISVPQPS